MPWANYAWEVGVGFGNTNEAEKSPFGRGVWPVRGGR